MVTQGFRQFCKVGKGTGHDFFGASYVGGSEVGGKPQPPDPNRFLKWKAQNAVSSVPGTQLRISFPGMAGVHSNSLYKDKVKKV